MFEKGNYIYKFCCAPFDTVAKKVFSIVVVPVSQSEKTNNNTRSTTETRSYAQELHVSVADLGIADHTM